MGLQHDTINLDEIVIRFTPNGINTIDLENDALSFNTGDQVISSLKGPLRFAIQTRNRNFTTDTVDLRVTSATAGRFKLFFSEYTNLLNVQFFIIDNYLHTKTRVDNNPIYFFDVDSNGASQGSDRFKIVFSSGSVLPVDTKTINAYRNNAGIEVDWTMLSEHNMNHYEVEKSPDARTFSKIGVVLSRGNSDRAVTYNWFDPAPFANDNFYRIKAVGLNNQISYSAIVKVNISQVKPGIAGYPNPVRDGILTVQMSNIKKGDYYLRLINSVGQVVYSKLLKNQFGSSTQVIPANHLSKGSYRLQLSNKQDNFVTTIIVQ